MVTGLLAVGLPLAAAAALWALLLLLALVRRGIEALSFIQAAMARVEARQILAMTPTPQLATGDQTQGSTRTPPSSQA